MIHDELNPKLFQNNKLKENVCKRILQIVKQFKEDCEIPLKVLDVYLVGSNAAYNYSDNSDLDIHIITNFGDNEDTRTLLNAYYNAKKTQFNKNYEIKINGIDVELYVEDINTSAISNGVYSALNDKWIKEPQKKEETSKEVSQDLLDKWNAIAEEALSSNRLEEIEKTIDTLYIIRKNSLLADGEYGEGNLLFKALRNNGMLDKLKDEQKELISASLSLDEMLKKYLKY